MDTHTRNYLRFLAYREGFDTTMKADQRLRESGNTGPIRNPYSDPRCAQLWEQGSDAAIEHLERMYQT